MVQGRFQALFLGDSVVWGQGLREEDKFSTWVIQWLNEYHPDLRAFKVVKAHSGAIIGAPGDPDDCDPGWPSEVPSPYPSVHHQLASFVRDNDPGNTDLVILDGGINDVGVRNIFNPRIPVADVRSLTRYACGTSMPALLREVAATFQNPRTKILVLGYYPILSEQSRLAAIGAMMSAYGVSDSGVPSSWNPWRTVVDKALRWKSDSDELLELAVANANAENPGRFIWVEPGIKAENSAFAPRPWVFGVRLPHISPEDDLAADRRTQCVVQPDPDLRAFGNRASVGHPNRWGARAYFNAIYPILQREYGF